MPYKEDGVDSGYRNFGRLCLALIPWALGIGATVWGGVYMALHMYHKEVEQEQRAAIYTGAQEKPKSKVQVEILPGNSCVHVTHVDYDPPSLTVYAENKCHAGGALEYLDWNWQEVSPDGTVLHESDTNSCPIPSRSGDKAECQFNEFRQPTADDRTAKLRVWLRD